MKKLIASPIGLRQIKQARKEKGWNLNDFRWLESASEVLGVSCHQEGRLASGISYGTWKRFLSGKYLISDRAFQAFCQVLGLKWQTVVAETEHNYHLEANSHHQDWGEAIDTSVFFGRTEELLTLENWIVTEKSRSILILGMGGIGKTSLAIQVGQKVQSKFDFLIWRSLCNAPLLEDTLSEIIQFISHKQETKLPETILEKINLLLQYLRQVKCLLILDNAESILEPHESENNSNYRQGYEKYQLLFQAIAVNNHQSCLLITSREKLEELSILSGEKLPNRCLSLQGLSPKECQAIFQTKGSFNGSDLDWGKLLNRYGGNPLALKIVASYIRDFFAGKIKDFLDFSQEGLFSRSTKNYPC